MRGLRFSQGHLNQPILIQLSMSGSTLKFKLDLESNGPQAFIIYGRWCWRSGKKIPPCFINSFYSSMLKRVKAVLKAKEGYTRY